MRIAAFVSRAAFAIVAAGLAACFEETPPAQGPQVRPPEPESQETLFDPAVSAPASPQPPTANVVKPDVPAQKTAKEILEAGGTFMFSLADSPEAKKVAAERCEKEGKKDAKKLEACQKKVEEEAAGEGIRFAKDDTGALSYTAFGKEKDKEVVHVRTAFTITKADGGVLTVTPHGKPEGKHAGKLAHKEIVIEVPDERTVKVNDPAAKKGVLVFLKK